MRFIVFLVVVATFAGAAVLGPRLTNAEPRPDVAVVPTPTTVIELFTSEGCSSCPPADALMAGLDKRDDVLVLGFHVDYWDRLGWKDRFSHADYTKRQRQYAQIFGERGVYTPQAVVGGTAGVVGSNRDAVTELLADAKPSEVFHVETNGDAISTTATPGNWVNAVYVRPTSQTDVKRGENAGRQLSHVNAVVAFTSAKASDDGKVRLTLERPEEGDRLVVYEQTPTGAITRVARSLPR